MENKRIVLDVDGVISAFGQGVIDLAKKRGMSEHFPTCAEEINRWGISTRFAELMQPYWLNEDFWMGLKPLTTTIPFKVTAYLTARPISGEITKRWLDKHGFPKAKVITVSLPQEKIWFLRELQTDIFVDDLHHTVREARAEGINALLYEAPYQQSCQDEIKDLPKISHLEEVLAYA